MVTYKNPALGLAQPDSAPASGAGGRWFESSHPDQYYHESDLPGVALFFCSPVPARSALVPSLKKPLSPD